MEPALSTRSKVLSVIWTTLLIVLPILLLSLIKNGIGQAMTLGIILASTILVIVMFAITYLVFRTLGSNNDVANYLLSINIAVALYHIISILGILANAHFGVSDDAFTFFQPVLILIGCVIGIRHYHLHLDLHWRFWNGTQVFKSILWGITFGCIFYLLKEPSVSLFSNTLIILTIYTLLVGISEELLFRFVIFRLAEKAYGITMARWLQAFVFAAMHFVYFGFIISYYSVVGTFLAETAIVSATIYFLALVWFGYRVSAYVGVRQTTTTWSGGNIVYAIIIHWITNLVTLGIIYSLI